MGRRERGGGGREKEENVSAFKAAFNRTSRVSPDSQRTTRPWTKKDQIESLIRKISSLLES